MNNPLKEESDALRLELKAWEKSFAAANQGRKAERSDIKDHPEIARKYKIYNKLRSSVSDLSKNSSTSTNSRKRPSAVSQNPLSATPQKHQKSSHSIQPYAVDPYDTPRSTHQTPTHSATLGPTPQKDGLVLGLFDLLSPASTTTQTPSRKSRDFLGPIASNSIVTPSKNSLNRQDRQDDIGSKTKADSKSPLSALKRSQPSSFLTPSIRRISDTPSKRTPGSRGRISKLSFDETPAFLRRDSQRMRIAQNGTLDEDGLDYDNETVSWSLIKVRMPAKPAGKGLSALVRSLRQMEDENLDEEMDLMRDMEVESSQYRAQKPMESQVFVVDSQAPEMPLGADGENESESDDKMEKEGRGRNGEPLRIWKKKGQKRTTRRVLMKPSKEKWKPEPQWNGGKDVDEDEIDREWLVAIAETQNLTTDAACNSENDAPETDHDIDPAGTEPESDFADDATSKKNRNRSAKTRRAAPKANEKQQASSQQEQATQTKGRSTVKKKVVSATAHANFRALKIKNRNSKGKGGGRFGRRR